MSQVRGPEREHRNRHDGDDAGGGRVAAYGNLLDAAAVANLVSAFDGGFDQLAYERRGHRP